MANKDDNLKEKQTKSFKVELLSWVKTIIIAIVLAYLITSFVIVNAFVPTGSMKNTIMPKDRLIASRLSYIFKDPERLDIIVFKYPDDERLLYVKRIIGLPGDTINISDGKVYINDSKEPLPDKYVTVEPMKGSWGPYIVPEDSYFMLGDNRNDSKDSRFWSNTFVKKEQILGKVIFKYYPKIEILFNK